MSRKPTKKRKTAFVPKVVFATALAGAAVIPICACGGRVGGGGGGMEFTVATMIADSGLGGLVADSGFRRDGVADSGFAATVAACCFDSAIMADVAADAFSVAQDAFGVADTGFAVADSGFGGVADAGFRDTGVPPGVAMIGFDSGDAEQG